MHIDFAQSFGERLSALEDFIRTQDFGSATARIEGLREEVLRFIDLVKLHPKIGRPADVFAAKSVEGQVRLAQVLQLASDAGLPEIREYVMLGHLVLYAHSDSRVLVLSIRHQRELSYAPGVS
jgi:plasmid stabilization system protein ParE